MKCKCARCANENHKHIQSFASPRHRPYFHVWFRSFRVFALQTTLLTSPIICIVATKLYTIICIRNGYVRMCVCVYLYTKSICNREPNVINQWQLSLYDVNVLCFAICFNDTSSIIMRDMLMLGVFFFSRRMCLCFVFVCAKTPSVLFIKLHDTIKFWIWR